jgi:hypothetical protein
LSINQESRRETLRHYFVVRGYHKGYKDRSVIFNPKIDSVHVTLHMLLWPNYGAYTYVSWIKELSSITLGLFKAVKTLEIHDSRSTI